MPRQGANIRTEIIPNDRCLIRCIKARLEKVKIRPANHGEKKRGLEVFKKFIGLKLFGTGDIVEKNRYNFSSHPQIVKPQGVSVIHKEIRNKTINQKDNDNCIYPFPLYRRKAHCKNKDYGDYEGRGNILSPKDKACRNGNQKPVVVFYNVK